MAITTGRTRWLLERLGARHGGDRPRNSPGLARLGAEGSLVSRFLIVTPRLKFRAIKTKQTPSSISNRYKTRFSRPHYHGKKPQIRRSRQDAGAAGEKANFRKERVRVEAKQQGMRRWLLVAQAEAHATYTASICPAPSRLGFSLVAPASCRLFSSARSESKSTEEKAKISNGPLRLRQKERGIELRASEERLR
jgi:hypothetical protein